MERLYDVTAMGEMLIDFTLNGQSEQGNHLFEACPGGAPCNVLAMLNKLGRKTAFIGKVGEDQFGRLLKGTIDELGIETKGLILDKEIHTTLAFVHTFPDGDREFSFYRKPGADMMLTEEEVDYDLIRQSRIFHFGTLSMTDEPVRSATKKALEVAKEAGCLITFDPNLRPPLWNSLDEAKKQMEYGFQYCDMLKISDNEIQFVSGKEDYDEGICYLQDKYNIPLIFLTMGKDGSRAYYKDIRVERKGFQVKAIEHRPAPGYVLWLFYSRASDPWAGRAHRRDPWGYADLRECRSGAYHHEERRDPLYAGAGKYNKINRGKIKI